jgi:hypothetical protein
MHLSVYNSNLAQGQSIQTRRILDFLGESIKKDTATSTGTLGPFGRTACMAAVRRRRCMRGASRSRYAKIIDYSVKILHFSRFLKHIL